MAKHRTKPLVWDVTKRNGLPDYFNKYGNVPFKKGRDGDIRYRVSVWLSTFRSFADLVKVLEHPSSVNLRLHIVKNYPHYEPIIIKLK